MKRQAAALFDSSSQWWLSKVGLAVAIGIAYFLAARLGLALRAQVGVAIFWPAAGIAVGALIALGPRARFSVAGAVAIASIVSSFMIGRSPWLAIAFAVINAGHPLLAAWLIERWFGVVFKLEDVPQVLGFLAASAVGAAMGATGAAIPWSFAEPVAFQHVWRVWFAASLLGTVTVAPLLIGLSEAVRKLPPRRELIEGTVGFVTLAVLCVFLISLPQEPWESALPVALVVPVVLWIAVRCRPVFAAAAAFAVALAIIWSTTFNIGHFGDASIPLAERIIAAQTHVLAGSLLALVLAALFADRRRSEAALKVSAERLQLALDGAELGAFSADLATGRLECDARAARFHGHNLPPTTIKESRRFVHPDDLVHIDAAVARAKRTGGVWKAEYRVMDPPDHPKAGEVRWVAVEASILFNGQGAPVRMLGVTRDITQRKQTEAILKEKEILLADALAAGQVIAFEWDARTGQSRRSDNANHVVGDEQGGTANSRRNDFLRRVHPDDREQFKTQIRKLCPENPSYALSFRFCGPDGHQLWLEETARGEFDATGRLLRIKGLTRDTTERKKAEMALAERNMQISLAGRAALVGSFAFDAGSERMRISPGYAAIHGFPDGTAEIARSEWQCGVHPEDRVRLEDLRSRCYRERLDEYGADYRIVRPGGQVRWIDARCFVSYHGDGRPKRVVGVNIDVTERKRAEKHHRAMNAELDHRVKNVLATVVAIITQTQDASSSFAGFVAGLEHRIKSMARTHELLSDSNWRGVSLAEIAQRELAPYAAGNTEFSGPSVTLKAEATQAVAMVLHELTTNAAKHGAFSNRSGRVLLRWWWLQKGSHGALAIEWREIGGPPVLAPSKSGYGTSIIRELIPYELGGRVDLAFASDGLRCRLDIPADWIRNQSNGNSKELDSATTPPH